MTSTCSTEPNPLIAVCKGGKSRNEVSRLCQSLHARQREACSAEWPRIGKLCPRSPIDATPHADGGVDGRALRTASPRCRQVRQLASTREPRQAKVLLAPGHQSAAANPTPVELLRTRCRCDARRKSCSQIPPLQSSRSPLAKSSTDRLAKTPRRSA